MKRVLTGLCMMVMMGGVVSVHQAGRVYAAGTCHVPFDHPTIAAAVADPACTVIDVSSGTYHEHGITIGRDVTINGTGITRPVIDAGGAGPVFTITAGASVWINTMTIQHAVSGTAQGGGAITNHGSLYLSGDLFDHNTNTTTDGNSGGGAVFSNGTRVSVTGSTFTNNYTPSEQANGGGAIAVYGGDLSVSGSLFSGNTTGDLGGAIHLDKSVGTVNVVASTFTANQAESCGGAIDHDEGILTISLSTFIGNNGSSIPGSGCGGAIDNDDGTLTVHASTFLNNVAPGDSQGGAIWTQIPTHIDSSTFSFNGAFQGGAIFVSGSTVTIASSLIGMNWATKANGGGGIYADNGAVVNRAGTTVTANTPDQCAGLGTITPPC